MVTTIRVAGKTIGNSQPCFVIAEAGVNHNGDLELAKRLVDVAVQAGANAVKFQTFNADQLVVLTAPKADYQLKSTDPSESQYKMLKQLELSVEAHQQLFAYCQTRGILFMSTPFDEHSADFLDDLGVPVFKIPSGEITNLRFLRHVARKGKPLIVSTGMSTLGEIEAALTAIYETGLTEAVLLHCVSNYPAEPSDINLRAMQTLEVAFGVPVGYSDHTLGIEIALAAAALGACILEKHFTVSRTLSGPDHAASLEPDELVSMVRGIRLIEQALGQGRKRPVPSEEATARVARKSLVAARHLTAGTLITEELLVAKRPGTGLPPTMLPYLVGRTLAVDLQCGDQILLDMLQPRA